MITEDGQYYQCDSVFGCEEKVKNDLWSKTKAEGWFFSRNGRFAFCPKHVPDHIVKWMEARKNG